MLTTQTILAAFGVSLGVCLCLMPIVKAVAIRAGVVSLPGGRHVHGRAIPRLGGVAICLAFLAAITTLFFIPASAEVLRHEFTHTCGLMAGTLVMCVVGVFDDARGVRPSIKLGAQVVVAVSAFACGYRIDQIYFPIVGNISMGVFALPVTVIWIAGIVNAVNLIDGLDGLAGGVVFFAAATNFVVAYLAGSPFSALFMSSLLGAVLAFLFFNFNPARIFMGDSGSYSLGFVLAATSLVGNAQKASTTVSLLVPMLALGVPIFDTLLAMIRRVLERRSIFAADRGHIHHRLLDMGITHRRAVLILYSVCMLLAVAAIGVYLGRAWQIGLALLAASVALVGLVRFVGYFEYFHQLTRQKSRIRLRQTELLRGAIREVFAGFDAARSEQELIGRLFELAEFADLGLVEVRSRSGGSVVFEWCAKGISPAARAILLSVDFPLGPDASAVFDIEFGWESESENVSPQIEILLQLITDALVSRLAALRSSLCPNAEQVVAVASVLDGATFQARESEA